jgi:hypothetical protein
MDGFAVHHQPVNQGENDVTLNGGKDIFPLKGSQEPFFIVRMVKGFGDLPDGFEEIRPVLGLLKAVDKIVGGAELPLFICFRVHQVDADEIPRQRMQTGVDHPFFLQLVQFSSVMLIQTHIRPSSGGIDQPILP